MTEPGADARTAAGTLLVGAAVEVVDVPEGTPMSGFSTRLSASTGVHDPTTVRALVIDDVALVTIDVCALHEDTCRAIESAATGPDGPAGPADLTGVVVAATHTHSGPSVACGRAGPFARDVHDALVAAAARALDRARAARTPASVEFAAVTGTGVARDRRHLDRTIDPPLTGIRFVAASGEADGRQGADGAAAGRVVTTLASYPCHPVVLNAENTLITGDYIHPMRERLEAAWGGPCVFLTGAAGDVNTGHTATSSYTSGVDPLRTFERATEIGDTLAAALLAADWTAPAVAGPATLATADVALGWEPTSREDVDARRREYAAQLVEAPDDLAALLRDWIAWADAWDPAHLETPWRGRVGLLDLGGAAAVLNLPGEPFLSAAEELLAAAPVPALVAGYCDGVPGYLPPEAAYPEGGYEVDDAHMYYRAPAPFRRGSAEAVVDAARGLLAGR